MMGRVQIMFHKSRKRPILKKGAKYQKSMTMTVCQKKKKKREMM